MRRSAEASAAQDIAALRSALMVREHLGFRRASEVLGVNPSVLSRRVLALEDALGVVTRFGIATCMAAVYALAATRLPILYRRWLVCAPLYGVILYGVMYRIVLPLRFPGAGGWKGMSSVLDICAHIGLALAAAFVLTRPAAKAARGAR